MIYLFFQKKHFVVTAPVGSNVPNRVSGAGGKGFDVEFTPKEAGLQSIPVYCLIAIVLKNRPVYFFV